MDLYHVLNRGVEKRDLFMDTRDYARFVHDMYEFNQRAATDNVRRRMEEMTDFVNPSSEPRKRIVDIRGWCLMKNHYHLLLSERIDGGMTLFIRRLNIGYANYFNQRYSRSGFLFQGRTKKKRIDSDAYFLHILHYIHLNPLDFLSGCNEWRQRKISSARKAAEHLESYRWSSYLDYCGKKNFPSILTTNLFQEHSGGIQRETSAYLRDIEIGDLGELTLE